MDTAPSNSAPLSNGQPTNGPPVYRKKAKPVDIFASKTKPRPLPKAVNGRLNTTNPLKPLRGASPQSTRSASPSKTLASNEVKESGFSDPNLAPGSYRDYKLVSTKRALREGLRFHLLQLPGEQSTDIRNQADFTRPVRLHRRDPRAVPAAPPKEDPEESKDGLNNAEREELNAKKEARQKEREANLALIAPSNKDRNGKRKMPPFKKKTAQVWYYDNSVEDRQRIQTNYEEKMPWHLEDFDNKHCYVGVHQAGSFNANAAFIHEQSLDDPDGRFRLLPVEKMYDFKTRRKLSTENMTIEEIDKAMKKKGRFPDFLVEAERKRIAQAAKENVDRKSRAVYSGSQKEQIAGRQGEEADFDFEDDFADDEEGNDIFGDKDEEEKEAERKIKEDQLVANAFDLKMEGDYDFQEEKERREEEARKLMSREIHRKLELREKNYNHGSDSEGSYSTDSEEERQRVEAEKKANREKLGSGISSGANTPSGRKEKHGVDSDRDGLKKSASSKSLKRPGSPNLSEASGTDASVRKKKKHRHLSSSQPTPQPSRPISPANVPSSTAPHERSDTVSSTKPSLKKRKSTGVRGGAGSESEGAAYSDGGAMSDGSKVKRIKLNMSSSSRAPSPPPPMPNLGFPTAQEIAAAIPANGIPSTEMLKQFKSRTKDRQPEFLNLVKSVARLDKGTKLLMPKTAAAAVPSPSAAPS